MLKHWDYLFYTILDKSLLILLQVQVVLFTLDSIPIGNKRDPSTLEAKEKVTGLD